MKTTTELKYKPVETKTYKKGVSVARKRGYDLTLLDEAVEILAKGKKLPAKYNDHQLKGRLSVFRECHIKGDWLLVYRIFEDKLILSLQNTGTHSDIF